MSATHQPAVLAQVPAEGTFLTLDLAHVGSAAHVLEAVKRLDARDDMVLGLGEPLVRGAGLALEGLRGFPALAGPSVAVPSTQASLFVFLAGGEGGERVHRARELVASLGEVRVVDDVPAFSYAGGRDLSGYEDGTENPEDRAAEVALVADGPARGGSFVAVQRWVHTLSALEAMAPSARDHVIGRSRETNEELDDAPESAHVKRSAQESFTPEAFMLRRSMPFGSATEHGLVFVAYGSSLDAYERVMRRMAGLDDGIRDAIFTYSRPVTGGYYFCPPVRGGRYDLTALVATT
ncbi:MAG: Dyp-type peroxidase [Polyangiaceae bacterium]